MYDTFTFRNMKYRRKEVKNRPDTREIKVPSAEYDSDWRTYIKRFITQCIYIRDSYHNIYIYIYSKFKTQYIYIYIYDIQNKIIQNENLLIKNRSPDFLSPTARMIPNSKFF